MSPHNKAGASAHAPKKRISGIIDINRRGTGYLRWPDLSEGAQNAKPAAAKKEREDIEIATEDLNGALHGDTVSVELRGLYLCPRGVVASVDSRAQEEYIATLKKKDGAWIGIAANQRFYRPMRMKNVPDGTAEETKALVRLVSFTGKEDPLCEVIEIVGAAGKHRTEMNAIVLEHGFKTTFPAAVAAEAKHIEETHAQIIAAEAPKRADYRNTTTFTIDPVDAKDFDDALSIEELPNGEIEVGVHIADATFFVRPGTALDDEAVKRGTSVYLVDATIPMLPHELSGNVCSLREGEDRLAFSAVFRMTKDGHVLDRKFEKSIICSNKRFTYEEAQAVLDKEEGRFVRELLTLRSLARILKKGREQEGAIDFGDNEVRFILDDEGKPLGVVRKERIETNSLIEEFMLLANREVAKYVSMLAKKVPESGYVFLYRIHDVPKEDRIEELATFVRAVGYEFGQQKKKYTARDIASLLSQIEGKPEQHLIRTATLRTMAKAIYSTKNIGHFGLAFEYYTHFTSPIRRYPDMLVHRILASHLDGKPLTRHEYGHLEKMCLTASAQEAKAVEAERDSIRYKQVEYMAQKIGQEFSGTISGVTDWGLYVEDDDSAAEGLVRVRTIGNDFYNYSAKEYALVGQRSKKKYALGDRVRVKLVAADLAARTLDFELVRTA